MAGTMKKKEGEVWGGMVRVKKNLGKRMEEEKKKKREGGRRGGGRGWSPIGHCFLPPSLSISFPGEGVYLAPDCNHVCSRFPR